MDRPWTRKHVEPVCQSHGITDDLCGLWMWSTGFPYVVDCKWVHVLSRWARAEAFMAHQLTNSARPTWHLRLSFSQFQFLSSEFRPKSRRKLALSERFQSLGRHCRLLSVLGKVRVGKIPDTQFPYPNYPNPDPKYRITISDSDHKNPKLVRVIRVMFPGTRTTQITRNISNICSSIPNMKT
jgi:hypothetical protein